MEATRFHGKMAVVHRYFSEGLYEKALARSRYGKARIKREKRPDPLQLGWFRFYEFKGLYALGRHAAAYRLLNRPEPVAWRVSSKNAAWMFSVGSELAARLDKPYEVLLWGAKCYELRLRDGDLVSAVQCAMTVCHLLSWIDRPDLNREFAEHLIELGWRTGAERAIFEGVRRLLDNFDASRNFTLQRRVRDEGPRIRRIETLDFAREKAELLRRIDALGA